MRILRIRFKNLNSLVGEWQIDLTHPAFASDGILAITGPTGAGKTTILDAICLALYGRTPRLNKIGKSGNEIMSRQTGECFAEVTFETRAGCFRCHWSQRRAHRKPDGELQAPNHEIVNAESGQVLESKIKGVAKQIEAATGMDFDRFTRSMLLAQGGFAAFLQAAPDERAPILEQITGTEIYSQISIRVHERQREEREKLTLLQAETAGIVILEPDQEKEITQALTAKQMEEAELAVKSTDLGKAIAWRNSIAALEKEIASLGDEANKLQGDIEAFKPDQEKLGRSLTAAAQDGPHATLTAARKQQSEDKKALDLAEKALPGLELTAREQADALKAAELRTVGTKEEQRVAAPILRKVRGLDQKLDDQKKAILEGEKGYKQDADNIASSEKNRIKEQEKRSSIQKHLACVEDYLREHARDALLISDLTGIETQLNNLIARQNEIQQKKTLHGKSRKTLEQATTSLAERQKQSNIRKQALKNASTQLQQGKDTLVMLLGDRLLREYRAEMEMLLRERAFLTKITELEEYRKKLEDGTPCPLCGATEHPFAEGNVPVPDAIDQKITALSKLINDAETQEAAIKKSEDAENSARQEMTEAEKLEATALHDKTAEEKNLAEMKDDLERLQTDFAGHKATVSAKLLPLGVTDIPEAGIVILLEALRARLESWQAQVGKKADLEKQIADIDSEVKRLDAVIETKKASLAEKLTQLEAVKKDFAVRSDERNALYGDEKTDEEEERLNKAVSDAEGAEKQARERHVMVQQQLNTARGHVTSLKERIAQQALELEKMDAEFIVALASAGFSDEEKFLAARLPVERRNELTAKAKNLDERRTDLAARQKDREARLVAEMARKVTDKSLEWLEPEFKNCEDSLEKLRDAIAGFRNRLAENTTAKERIKQKQALVDAQKNECRRWETLHALIGSADGKKYRNFAQGLTFDLMIGHANRQLQKMTDRYVLIRDNAQPLDLNVVDSYQGGEIRSTKNLSGGESFIVSLSLALGLSHMASKNVRVDSLFLDEGFGTLDEEALDIALETLASLKQDGKLIGVISHVAALKERIGAQIQVMPQTGGRSQISGPGCKNIGSAENIFP